MTVPRVSVIIPAYNREKTIRSAVESVLEQSLNDIEVIVVDDGSTDETLAEVKAIEDSRLRVIISENNTGASAARNRGIDAAHAPWVAFNDSDDLWQPEKLARQMAILETPENNFIAAYCGMNIVENGGKRRYLPDPRLQHRKGDVLPGLVFTSFISTQTLVVRRDMLEKMGGFDEDLHALEDWELALRIAEQNSIGLVDMPLVEQRFSENSITNDSVRRVQALAQIVEKHAAIFDRYPHALAERHYELSGGYRRCGDLERALAHIAEARRRIPLRMRWWIMSFWLHVLVKTRSAQPSGGR